MKRRVLQGCCMTALLQSKWTYYIGMLCILHCTTSEAAIKKKKSACKWRRVCRDARVVPTLALLHLKRGQKPPSWWLHLCVQIPIQPLVLRAFSDLEEILWDRVKPNWPLLQRCTLHETTVSTRHKGHYVTTKSEVKGRIMWRKCT